jgi:hypothetical protein
MTLDVALRTLAKRYNDRRQRALEKGRSDDAEKHRRRYDVLAAWIGHRKSKENRERDAAWRDAMRQSGAIRDHC